MQGSRIHRQGGQQPSGEQAEAKPTGPGQGSPSTARLSRAAEIQGIRNFAANGSHRSSAAS